MLNFITRKIEKIPDLWLIIISAAFLGISRLPLHSGFLVFFALIPLFFFFSRKIKVKKIIFSGFIFAFFYNTISLHWISLVTFPGFVGMYLLFGIYFAVLFFLIYFISQKFPKIKYIVFISFWISFELLHNFGEFRFPWLNLAYSLADYLILIQFAEIGGVYLLSLLIIIINILLYELIIGKKRLIYLIILLLTWNLVGFIRLNTIKLEETDQNIAIVQASIPQDKKWEETYLDSTVDIYVKLTREAVENKPDLIIWPESAIPVYLARTYKYRNIILNLAKDIQTDIYVAFPDYEIAPSGHPFKYVFYNSSTVFDKQGSLQNLYRKNYLVPFGERIPFLQIFPFLWKLDFGQANFEYGEKPEFYYLNSYRYSPLICFEIAFPVLSRNITKGEADFIVNLTNDAWFKHSAGTYQHAVMTIFRAIETRKQIYRAANTGYSLVVSPSGKILKKTALFEETVIFEKLYIYKNETIYTKYLYFFPYIFLFCSMILVLVYFIKIGFKV